MLTLKNISYKIKNADGQKDILKNISFTFLPGKNYVITGANGCGKSTLAKIIMGITKQSGGKVFIDVKDISKLDVTQRAKLGVSYSMQQPVRFKGLSVKDILEISAGKTLTSNQACQALSQVGLCAKDYLDRKLDASLSGGELKRIEIASVLARDSKINIFDEPEAGIDIWSFNGLVSIFKNAISKDKVNIIISHQEKLFKSADEIVLMSDGKFVLSGSPEKVLPAITTFNACRKLEVGDE